MSSEASSESPEGGSPMSSPSKAAMVQEDIERIIQEEEAEEIVHDLHTTEGARHLFENAVLRRVVDAGIRRSSVFGSKIGELKQRGKGLIDNGRRLSVVRESEKLKSIIQEKRKKLLDELSSAPFVRMIDRIAFTMGLVVMCLTEYVLLRYPHYMYLWYTAMIFPLMAIRFFMYHKLKFHYFMLDFCYFCQLLLLFYLFGHHLIFRPESRGPMFKAVFALSSGPLAWGTVVWRNSLVFHDLDKLTSVFIHMCPPLVTFCLRWYPSDGNVELACGGQSCSMSWYETFVMPMMLYLLWQIGYYIKTEMIDRKKLANDSEIMTSLRWMSEKHPHPLYQFAKKCGYRWRPTFFLMMVQIVYTLATLAPLPLIMSSYYLHCGALLVIFISVIWNGASYYFEVFSEGYSKRLEMIQKEDKPKEDKPNRKIQSFKTSLAFFGAFLVVLLVFLSVAL